MQTPSDPYIYRKGGQNRFCLLYQTGDELMLHSSIFTFTSLYTEAAQLPKSFEAPPIMKVL